MRSPRITPATLEHLDEIRDLDAREFRGANYPEGSTFWVVDGDPELGYCAAVIGVDPVRPDGPRVVHLTRGYVGEPLRGSGLQGRMIRLRLAWGRRHGVTRAQTYTWRDNIPSMRSLARAGFLPLRYRDGYVRWEKELT